MEIRELRPDPMSDLYETRRSRFVPIVLRQVAILVAVAAVVTAVGILRYSPLAARSAEVIGTAVHASGTERTVAYSPGGSFAYTYDIANAGRWGVTIRGIELPRHPTFASAEALLVDGSSSVPLTDFSLAPGEAQRVSVRITFAECTGRIPVGTRDAWSSDAVRFSVLSIPRTTSIDLPVSITLDTTAARPC